MRIAVIGAYGYTGRLICKELQDTGFRFLIYGRNKEKIERLKDELSNVDKAVSIDLRKKADIDLVILEADIFINCAGPFTEESSLFLETLAESGKIYLDITGEIGFVRSSRELYHQKAKKSKSIIIHGCAFESLLADLAMQKIASIKVKVKSINTFYRFNQHSVSPGTRITMKMAKFRDSLKIKNKHWCISDSKHDQLKVNIDKTMEQTAIPYPLPEIAYAHWNWNVNNAASFLLMNTADALFFSEKKGTLGDPLENLDKIRFRKNNGPSIEKRGNQKSELFVRVLDENEKERILLLKSKDMYLLTAKAIVLAVKKVVTKGSRIYGVISPAQLFLNDWDATIKELNIEVIEQPNFVIHK